MPFRNRLWSFWIASICFMSLGAVFPASLRAQTSVVQSFGTLPVSQVAGGCGININTPHNDYFLDWEFARVKAMGCSTVRIQCSWQAVEQMNPPPATTPANPRFVQTPACVAALTSAKNYGLHVTELAAFGPPYNTLLAVTLPNGANVGDTSLSVALDTGYGGGNLTNVRPINDFICPMAVNDDGTPNVPASSCQSINRSSVFTYKGVPEGSMLTGVTQIDSTHATLNLASAVKVAQPGPVPQPSGCSMTNRGNTLICTTASFDSSLVDGTLRVTVPGAGVNGVPLTSAISSVTNATTLVLRKGASAAVSGVAAAVTRLYAINDDLYAYTFSQGPSDTSVVAYGDYATFLAQDMAGRGITGDIEIWNEPPWSAYPWDYGPLAYDYVVSGNYSGTATYGLNSVVFENSKPYISLTANNLGNDPASTPAAWSASLPSNAYGGTDSSGVNFGFVANIQARTSTWPAGVTATWNGTSGNGTQSLLGPNMLALTGVALTQPSTIFTRESFHPYPSNPSWGNPEGSLMDPACLAAAAASTGNQANIFANGRNCYLPGQATSANLMEAVELSLVAQRTNPAYGLGHSITETNNPPPVAGQQVGQARSNVRQFLASEALGISPVEFFSLWTNGPTDPSFSFLNSTDSTNNTVTLTPSYTAMQTLMTNLAVFNNTPPVASPTLPSVASYTGTFPLALEHLVGARAGATSDAIVTVAWQITAGTASTYWYSVPSPAAAPLVLTMANGRTVTAAIDTVTGLSVPFSNGTGQATIQVQDNPVLIVQELVNLCPPPTVFCGVLSLGGRLF